MRPPSQVSIEASEPHQPTSLGSSTTGRLEPHKGPTRIHWREEDDYPTVAGPWARPRWEGPDKGVGPGLWVGSKWE